MPAGPRGSLPRDRLVDSGGIAVDRRRTKKLRVAFQFQFANQAAWKCDACRKSGLEASRRCGWIEPAARLPRRVVWARNGVTAESCPRSYITAQSLAWVERYQIWQAEGRRDLLGLPSKTAEALMLLDGEGMKERQKYE